MDIPCYLFVSLAAPYVGSGVVQPHSEKMTKSGLKALDLLELRSISHARLLERLGIVFI